MEYAYTLFQNRTLRARCYHCAAIRSVKIFCLETRIRTTGGILHDNIYSKTQRIAKGKSLEALGIQQVLELTVRERCIRQV